MMLPIVARFRLAGRAVRGVLDVAAEQHERRHGQQDGGEEDEDAGLDALERPVAVGRLVGENPRKPARACWQEAGTVFPARAQEDGSWLRGMPPSTGSLSPTTT